MIKITFVGTGAADWDWTNHPPGTRGSTATLVGSECLIDAGTTILRNLAEAHVRIGRLRDLIITHGHQDHFCPDAIRAIAEATNGKLRIWASPEVLAQLPEGLCKIHPVLPGDSFLAAGFAVTALPSNHATADASEQTLHYLFQGRGARLLYALDGAWMTAKAYSLLKQALGGKPLTHVIWDATSGNSLHDWRFASHNDLGMVRDLRASMLDANLISPETRHIFDHVARTLWPETPSAREQLAAQYDGLLAEDGMTIAL